MQLLKMENDKLPKEICTYNKKTPYILEGIYLRHYQNNKVTNILRLYAYKYAFLSFMN